MKALSSAERRELRARAHSLNPVVIIGNDGLTPGVSAEVERSLKAHELIKIRVGGADHAERESICESLCGQTGASPVQHIGKILVIYRKKPREEPRPAARKPRQVQAKPVKRPTRKADGRPNLFDPPVPFGRPLSRGKTGNARSAGPRRRATRG